jgi:hypothetical protein
MPILSNRIFDNNGHFYNITKVLNKNLHLNETAYQVYGDIYLILILFQSNQFDFYRRNSSECGIYDFVYCYVCIGICIDCPCCTLSWYKVFD